MLVILKSAASAPLLATLEIVKVAPTALLVMVTVCALLEVPTAWLEKVRLVGDGVAVAGVATMSVTFRTRHAFRSAMYRLAEESPTNPCGCANCAIAAGPPSPAEPNTPFPTTV